MKRIHALIILISLIVTIIILIAYVVGNIKHKIENTAPTDISSVLSEDNVPLSSEQSIFALQLFASNSFRKVSHLKEELLKNGQRAKITKLKRDGEIVYRLRAEQILPEDEAIALGEQLKSQFSQINSYWLEEQSVMIIEQKPITEFDQFESNTEDPFEQTAQQTTNPKPTEQKPVITPKQAEPGVELMEKETEATSDADRYEIQLLASSNYKSIARHKTMLENSGYPTKIYKVIINGKTIYRLRLKKRYSRDAAIKAGKKLIAETDFENYWLQDLIGNEIHPEKKPEPQPTFTGDYDVQILANPSKGFVEGKLYELEKSKYKGKIVTTEVKGKTYYRLRLRDSYSFDEAKKVAEKMKNDVKFVSDYWVVKADKSNIIKVAEVEPQANKSEENSDILVSLNPRYAPRNILYTVTCPANNIEIRIGPGNHYDLDEIGKLMKDVKLYVVEERNGWLRFRLMKNNYNWTGWVRQKDLK